MQLRYTFCNSKVLLLEKTILKNSKVNIKKIWYETFIEKEEIKHV